MSVVESGRASPRHSRLLLAGMAVSISLHLAAWLAIPQSPDVTARRTIEVQLLSPRADIADTPSRPEPPADTPLSPVRPGAQRLPPITRPVPPAVAAPGGITLDLALPAPAPEAPVEGGGTVFHPDLRKTLAAIQGNSKRRRTFAGYNALDAHQSQQGGRWATLVEWDGRCFRVLEVNPLEPLSTEQWFPVKCR